jgi:hypothetical protein
MSKKKTKTEHKDTTSFANTSTASVGESPDLQKYREWQPEIDPSIPYRFARERTHLQDSFNNPLGQYTTPAVREATQRAAEGDLMQQEGQAMREGQYDVNSQTGGKQGFLASFTAPRTSTSSGTGTSAGTGTNTYTPSIMDDISQGVGIGKTATGGKFLK